MKTNSKAALSFVKHFHDGKDFLVKLCSTKLCAMVKKLLTTVKNKSMSMILFTRFQFVLYIKHSLFKYIPSYFKKFLHFCTPALLPTKNSR